MGIEVSIIIVNYNSEDVLDLCLQSIEKYVEGIDFETIVVDNNSEKNTLESLQQKYTRVKWIFSPINGGFGYANNLGNTIASGKYIYLLNPDTELLNNAPAILSNFMDMHSGIGVCGGSMFNEDLTPTTSFYDIDLLKLEYEILFNKRKNYRGVNTSNEPKPVLSIVGSNFFIRRNLYNDLGGFDSDFFMYFEELELCSRVRKKGYKLLTVPEARIMHLHGATGENKNDTLKAWLMEEHGYSKWLYFYKTKGILNTKILYNTSKLKIILAIMYFELKKNSEKLDYWNQKKRVSDKSFVRFMQKINK